MNDAIIVIFGASGDLAQTKLIPALYYLCKKKLLGNFAWVGAAYDNVTLEDIVDKAEKNVSDGDQAVWNELRKRGTYTVLQFSNAADYKALDNIVLAKQHEYGISNHRLFYLATAAEFFCVITQNLVQQGLAQRQSQLPHDTGAWHRVVYEKPFGTDQASAQAINRCIADYLDEQQVWRIDHYLSKELVANIATLRFANTFFEPLWSHDYIDSITIDLLETASIKNRGPYYDKYGALKDVVQNHLLQLLALTAIEAPYRLFGDTLKDAKVAVLKNVRVLDGIFGQYNGYRQEKGVRSDSKANTYVALKLAIDTPRWTGVPFLIRTGKSLKRHLVEISVIFKPVICHLEELKDCQPNMLRINIFPEEGFAMQINAQEPRKHKIVPVNLEFCYPCKFGYGTSQAYEKLLQEIMQNDQVINVRFDEIEAAWSIIDAVQQLNLPLYSYDQGSDGPEEAKRFFNNDKE